MTTLGTRDAAAPSGDTPPRRRPDRRLVVFLVILAVYVVYSVFVVVPSWVGDFDKYLYDIHIKRDILTHDQYRAIYWYLTIGQRAPVLLAFLPYFLWISWQRCTIRPITAFVAAQLLLNVSVGVVKLATGRIGPKETVDVFRVFDGGNIYPSGHVSNAVVIWGLAAMFVTPRFRKLWIGIAVWVSVTVGLGTVAINTHWFADIVGGWFAGVLVLIALPWIVPTADRIAMGLYDKLSPRVVPKRLRDAIDARRPSRSDGPSAERHPGELGRPIP